MDVSSDAGRQQIVVRHQNQVSVPVASLSVLEGTDAETPRDVVQFFNVKAIRSVVLRLNLNLVGNFHCLVELASSTEPFAVHS